MNKDTVVGIAIILTVIIVIISVAYYAVQLDISVVYKSTIKVSAVTTHEDPILHFKLTHVETIGGDAMDFWGDVSSQIQAGSIYKIVYQKQYYGLPGIFYTLKSIEFIGSI